MNESDTVAAGAKCETSSPCCADETRLTKELIEPAVEPAEDKLYRLVSIGSQMVPVWGGAIGEAFHAFVKSPAERRQRKAIVLMMDAINELYERTRRSHEDLVNDEAFVSTLFTASSMAVRTSDAEKLDAIKHAVISSALNGAPGEAIQQMYLTTLADMTSIHLRLLPYFKSLVFATVRLFTTGDRTVQNSYYDRVSTYVQEGISRGLVERATRDLHSWGVIAIPVGCPEAIPGPNFIVMMLTDFGRGLTEFIEV
jgi:hypothetical protein